jgi:aspartate aminotransferase-like enzyme
MKPIKTRLFTPGPVEIPARILRALSQTPPHHRTEVFRSTLKRVSEWLRVLHGTAGEVFLLGSSGTGAMEAAVVNVLAPGDRAVAISGGKFGERWAKLCAAYGIAHETLAVEWGQSADPGALDQLLARTPGARVVFATHSETSTGALHDVRALAEVAHRHGAKIVVDSITSLGIHPFPQDEWGVDVAVCGSQKGLMIPPGLATVSLSPSAAALIEGEHLPRFYFDLVRARKGLALGETPWTPPVTLVLALEESLAMIREEGLAAVHERHHRLSEATRAGATALGFTVFAAHPSHAVTALVPPAGVDASAVVRRLREEHGMIVAGGQDHLKGKVLRIGHMGNYDLGDVHAVLGALEEVVAALGAPASGAREAASLAWQRA